MPLYVAHTRSSKFFHFSGDLVSRKIVAGILQIFSPLPFQAMDTSNPAPFVNAQILPNYVGRKVRLVVQVNRSDGGGVTTATSTDDHQLTIKELPPVPPMNYVEVIGIAETDQSVNAEIWTDFGTTFDTKSYNQLCQLANGEFRSLFL
ncbi:hypothetical protein L6164_007113 [Bauhinia variegata]|uniref:Uncharacterized protein n=1 Tax=Bauhinia variegata TaxID=167791 RepID=A0ACB9PZ97_BAUVA|nr:hypothetical protein L6164_007113 [Bauhinia variegata]